MLTPDQIVAPVLVRQGHLYQHGEQRVIALESGHWADVAELLPGSLWLGRTYRASAYWLTPLPMRYYRDETPR